MILIITRVTVFEVEVTEKEDGGQEPVMTVNMFGFETERSKGSLEIIKSNPIGVRTIGDSIARGRS